MTLKDGEGTLYLDKEDGKPVSLVSTRDADGEGTLNFTYDKVEPAQAPPASEIVGPAELGS